MVDWGVVKKISGEMWIRVSRIVKFLWDRRVRDKLRDWRSGGDGLWWIVVKEMKARMRERIM